MDDTVESVGKKIEFSIASLIFLIMLIESLFKIHDTEKASEYLVSYSILVSIIIFSYAFFCWKKKTLGEASFIVKWINILLTTNFFLIGALIIFIFAVNAPDKFAKWLVIFAIFLLPQLIKFLVLLLMVVFFLLVFAPFPKRSALVSIDKPAENKEQIKRDTNLSDIIMRILLVLLPVILSFFFLFSPFERIELSKYTDNENITLVKISPDVISQPSLKNHLRDLLQVPFNLKWYEVCFSNLNSRIIYAPGIEEGVNATVYFNINQSILSIPRGETKCVKFQLDKDFTYQWRLESSLNPEKLSKVKPKKVFINATHYSLSKTAKISPDTTAYAKPELDSILIKNMLVLISWSSLIWLYTRIRKFVINGKDS